MSFDWYRKNLISNLFCFFVLFLFIGQPLKVEAEQSRQILFNQALQASQDGDFIEALQRWDKLLEISPKQPLALSNRGNVRLALGDPEGAIVDQTLAIELLPDEPDPHLNRGTAEEALQRWEDAENDYNWILERNPDDPSALYNLGNVKGSQGDWLQAESLFCKASVSFSGFTMARSSQALAQYQLGQFEIAESELRSLIRKYPMFADARAALTALLWRKGFLGEAESNWVAAVGLDSRYRQPDWLLDFRRWPPQPTNDLMAFLALESP